MLNIRICAHLLFSLSVLFKLNTHIPHMEFKGKWNYKVMTIHSIFFWTCSPFCESKGVLYFLLQNDLQLDNVVLSHLLSINMFCHFSTNKSVFHLPRKWSNFYCSVSHCIPWETEVRGQQWEGKASQFRPQVSFCLRLNRFKPMCFTELLTS